MLTSFPEHPDGPHEGASWIDLLNPTAEEVKLVEGLTGLHVPTLAELREIESSSRLAERAGALYLSLAAVSRTEEGLRMTPVGFVLTAQRLLTVRFDHLAAIEQFTTRCHEGNIPDRTPMGVFIGICETMVDRIADSLERQGDLLDLASQRVFSRQRMEGKRPRQAELRLRGVLASVGHAGDTLSKLRDTLLGVGRIVPYVQVTAAEWTPKEMGQRLRTLRRDIQSLNDYDTHLSNKVQFLLDATLGFINIEQNNIIRVLTVVSVVGIPPTFVASMYGMNFKNMPELEWAWGYPYGLALILLSAIAPVVWFRVRGWL